MLFGLIPWLAETAIGKWFSASFLTKIPRGVWEAFAVLGYALALYLTHSRAVHDHDTALIAANNAQWEAKYNALDAQMLLKDAQLFQMASSLRKQTDETNTLLADDADHLSVSGPGKAACPRLSPTPAAPGGPHTPPSKPGAAGPSLPPADGNDLSAVDWNWLVGRSLEHDELLNEDKAWRDWYAQVLKAWPKKTP